MIVSITQNRAQNKKKERRRWKITKSAFDCVFEQ